MPDPDVTVRLVDDEPSVLKALSRLLRSAGWKTGAYDSPEAFLRHDDPSVPGCLVLDVAMPVVDGLELQRRLAQTGWSQPIIFLTGNVDVSTTVRAMRAGALNLLTKPVRDDVLLGAIAEAVEKDRVARCAHADAAIVRARLATLTPREREVFDHVVEGLLNKQIAHELGTVEKTIKVHRARVMEKMGARSLAELARMAERLGLSPR